MSIPAGDRVGDPRDLTGPFSPRRRGPGPLRRHGRHASCQQREVPDLLRDRRISLLDRCDRRAVRARRRGRREPASWPRPGSPIAPRRSTAEVVTVQTRATRIGRSSVHARAPVVAAASSAARPAGRGQRVDPRPLRLCDGSSGRPAARACRGDRGVRGPRPQVTARKIATAFCPPNPKPLTATVSILALRATSGV